MRIEINSKGLEMVRAGNQYLHHDTIRAGYEAGLITAQGAIIYYLISWQKSNKTCYESKSTIAKKLGMSIVSLGKAQEKLTKKGILNRIKQVITTEKGEIDVLAWTLTSYVNKSDATKGDSTTTKGDSKDTTKRGTICDKRGNGIRQKGEKEVQKDTTKGDTYNNTLDNNNILDNKKIRIVGGIDSIVGGVGGEISLDDQNDTDYRYIPTREEEEQLGIHINRE